jgi:hypothetical protein
MTSSPGEILDGFFYHAYAGETKKDWKQWHWTLLDNPHFQKPATNPKFKDAGEEELDTICRLQFGGDRGHPAFAREYLGVYKRDDSNLIYPYTEKNVISRPAPLPREQYALGLDLGVSSACAFAVLKYSQYSREVQIVETYSETEMLVDDLAEQIKFYQEKYDLTAIIADTGGLGAAFVQELRRRYQLPIRAADKTDKSVYQKIFRNDLISGYIKIIKDLTILQEYDKILKDAQGQEIKGQKNHEADAALYVYRYVYSTYLKVFTPALTDEERMEAQLVELALAEKAEQDELKEDARYEY